MLRFAVITFNSTHFALKAKKVLEKEKKKIEMIPVPREFSSNCGFCCKISWDLKDEIQSILDKYDVEIEQIHLWERDDDEKNRKKFRFV